MCFVSSWIFCNKKWWKPHLIWLFYTSFHFALIVIDATLSSLNVNWHLRNRIGVLVLHILKCFSNIVWKIWPSFLSWIFRRISIHQDSGRPDNDMGIFLVHVIHPKYDKCCKSCMKIESSSKLCKSSKECQVFIGRGKLDFFLQNRKITYLCVSLSSKLTRSGHSLKLEEKYFL